MVARAGLFRVFRGDRRSRRCASCGGAVAKSSMNVRVQPCRLVALALTALAIAPVVAAEPDELALRLTATPRSPRLVSIDPGRVTLDPRAARLDPRGRFLRDHLLPRMDQQLHKLGPLDEACMPGRWLADTAYVERLGERSAGAVEHAAGKALQDFLLEETTLGRVAGAIESAAERGAPGALSRPGGGLRLDLAISHGAPQLLLGRALRDGSLRFSLGPRADVGLRLRQSWMGHRTSVAASLDRARDRYSLSCSMAF